MSIPKHVMALANHKGAAIVHAGGMIIPVKILDIESEDGPNGTETAFKAMVVNPDSVSTTEMVKSAKAAAMANTPFGATRAFREVFNPAENYNQLDIYAEIFKKHAAAQALHEVRKVEMATPCVVASRPVGMLDIDRVIFNDPATIVFWKDGTKTVVKCQEGDTYSKETGLALCIAKKALGNKGNFNDVFKKHIPND